MEKRKRDKNETKKRIAEKAKELFSQKGYAATSIEDIIAAAESSKGNVYYHFKSKENLFLYLLEAGIEEWIDQWKKKESQYHTASDKLYGIALHVAEDFQNPLIKAAEEFSGSQTADPEVLSRVLEITRIPRRLYHEVLAEGIASGEFASRDVTELAFIFSGLLGGLGAAYYEVGIDELKRLYKEAITVFLHGISLEK
ncbi:TetR/AcrR family transcriptional regulator [Aneurinibacillus uraniidurans]|uniref:TetR/AcrR family transcriptional regulator n=1 Tax=Aneurinibacillus uraniidurans TaxID=2966586 RepID=UPI00234935C6|nr:TetR/AcrR family transcriptional regulator [Aneurinibacillus sp. B1]WCN39624.1 TetR family transcriptional regulator C-terminal domain-containing protein [Aneurinibacillus sp. B1]